jgi:hypothetical protein
VEVSIPARSCLSLALLVLGILADDAYHTLASNHLALDANLFDRCPDLHDSCYPSLRTKFRREICLLSLRLFIPIHNPAAIQVVWAQLYGHAITGQNPDKILAHPSRDMGQDLVIVLELDLEHGIGQRLKDGCHHFNRVFLRQYVSVSAGPCTCPRLREPNELFGQNPCTG